MDASDSYMVFNEYYQRYEDWYLKNYNIMRAERDCIKSMGVHGRILDVGVGTGILTHGLSKTMVGIDPSINMLLYARKRGFLAINSFGEQLPFTNNYFDTVIMVVTICFVENPLKILSEINRVLRDDGILVVCIVPKNSSWGIFYNWLKNSGKTLFYKYARFYTLQEIHYMLANTGFTVKETCSTLLYTPNTPPIYEIPVKSLIHNAGFICLKAEKNKYQKHPP